jgi:two-component system, chemotaxis family, chemotaxis protein CheY
VSLNLERIVVLFVDDSPFIRSLMTSALRILGVTTVLVASDGGSAIDLLKLTKTDPIRAGAASVDLVISNWDMSPVDGLMLLRFIRRHKDSPDRFLPFLFLTAFTEKLRVEEARGLGAHDVISKPFTIGTIGERLQQVILRNRQFVHTRDYFGPDRRRPGPPPPGFKGPDRRLLNDKSPEVELVHG